MQEALDGHSKVVQMRRDAEDKMKASKTELEKTSAGKATFKNFFKSNSAKDTMKIALEQSIQKGEKSLNDFSELLNYITIFDSTIAIEEFKRSKTTQYKRMLRAFSECEISNAYLLSQLYNTILHVDEMKQEEM
jgi:hypothetical protein